MRRLRVATLVATTLVYRECAADVTQNTPTVSIRGEARYQREIGPAWRLWATSSSKQQSSVSDRWTYPMPTSGLDQAVPGGEGRGQRISTRRLKVPKRAPATNTFEAKGPSGAVLLSGSQLA